MKNLGPTMGGFGEQHTDVRHVCPWCGGDFAKHLGALVVVTACWACKGAGTLSNDELDTALRIDTAREEGRL